MIEKLDYIFPFIVFSYGVIMMVVLSHPTLVRLADENLSAEFAHQFKTKRPLALACLVIGGLWSLQNLWLF